MKQTIARNFLGILTASVILFSFSNCTKDAKDAQMMKGMNERSDKSMNLKKQYMATLSSLNNSGATGTAMLTLDGNMLTVKIDAMGLEPNKMHPQHIHGFTENNRNSVCPPMSADTDGDGLVELEEGVPYYGPVLLDLGPMPMADAKGEVHYMRTFPVDQSWLPLQNRTIVLHGLTVMNQYWITLPVACGQIQNWGM